MYFFLLYNNFKMRNEPHWHHYIPQFLIRNFGDIGKFVALIILVLQLAASGGTFPVETISKGFQCVTGILPMTYTIKLTKLSIN